MEAEVGISAVNRDISIMSLIGMSSKPMVSNVGGNGGCGGIIGESEIRSGGSNSSSSSSSGYGSATTTPTNYNYESASAQSSTSTTPVAIAEPMPLATIAAITPYYNESINTQNLNVPHYQQQEQQLHAQQQQAHHYKQNFYRSYDYQQPSTITPYEVGMRNSYDGSGMSSFEPYDTSPHISNGAMYKPSIFHQNGSIDASKSITSTTPIDQAMQSHPHQEYYFNNNSTKSIGNSLTQKTNPVISNNNGNKPQAAATPFFAQPYSQQYGNSLSGPSTYYDNYNRIKHSNEYHDPFGDNLNSAAVTYQQHKYYATAKQQIKEPCPIIPNYTTLNGTPKQYSEVHAPSINHTTNQFTNSNVTSNGFSCYDKYLYPRLLTNSVPTNKATYRNSNIVHPSASASASVSASVSVSATWPWPIENGANNTTTVSPPTVQSLGGHIPTATVAPTQATYLNQSVINAQRKSPCRLHHEKYNDKYATHYPTPGAAGIVAPLPQQQQQPYAQQAYLSSAPTNCNVWPGSHAQHLPMYNERLPSYGNHGGIRHIPNVPLSHPHTGPAHHSLTYFTPNTAPTIANNRQTCCSKPFQPQPCYFSPHSQTNMKTIESVNSPQSHTTLIHRFTPYQTNCKYANSSDNEKINPNNSNNLYLSNASTAVAAYDNVPSNHDPMHHSNYSYPIQGNSSVPYQHGSNNSQEFLRTYNSGPIMPAKNAAFISPTTSPFTNDLNLVPNTYIANPSNHNNLLNMPPPPPSSAIYGSNSAKRALMDYRKHGYPSSAIQQHQSYTMTEDFCHINQLGDQEQQSQNQQHQQHHHQQFFLQQQQHQIQHQQQQQQQQNVNNILNSGNLLNTFESDTQNTATNTVNAVFDQTTNEINITMSSLKDTTKLLNGDNKKNLSIRDFIENWNDDEDDTNAINEDLCNNITNVLNEVSSIKKTTITNNKMLLNANKETESTEKNFIEDDLLTNNITDGSAQYVNLPDIIVDIEKSANTMNNATSSESMITQNNDLQFAFNGFDVEKELDQLRLKQYNNNRSIIDTNENAKDNGRIVRSNKDTGQSIIKNDIYPICNNNNNNNNNNNKSTINNEKLNTVPQTTDSDAMLTTVIPATVSSNIVIPPPSVVTHFPCKEFSHNDPKYNGQKQQDHISKDIESSNSGHSHNSNETTFEREYQTFIHKINNELTSTPINNVAVQQKCRKNLRELYKVKLKNRNKAKWLNNLKMKYRNLCLKKPCRTVLQQITHCKKYENNSNDSKYAIKHSVTKSSLKQLQKTKSKSKRKVSSVVKSLSVLNIMQPCTLQGMCIKIINTKDFRENVLKTQMTVRTFSSTSVMEVENDCSTHINKLNDKDSPVREDEPHICTDPQCETCDVIKSLLESDKYVITENDDTMSTSNEYYNNITNADIVNLPINDTKLEETAVERMKLIENETIATNTNNSSNSNNLPETETLSDIQFENDMKNIANNGICFEEFDSNNTLKNDIGIESQNGKIVNTFKSDENIKDMCTKLSDTKDVFTIREAKFNSETSNTSLQDNTSKSTDIQKACNDNYCRNDQENIDNDDINFDVNDVQSTEQKSNFAKMDNKEDANDTNIQRLNSLPASTSVKETELSQCNTAAECTDDSSTLSLEKTVLSLSNQNSVGPNNQIETTVYAKENDKTIAISQSDINNIQEAEEAAEKAAEEAAEEEELNSSPSKVSLDKEDSSSDSKQDFNYEIYNEESDISSISSTTAEDFKGFQEQYSAHSFGEDSAESFRGFNDKNQNKNLQSNLCNNDTSSNSSSSSSASNKSWSTTSTKIQENIKVNTDDYKNENNRLVNEKNDNVILLELNELEALKYELSKDQSDLELKSHCHNNDEIDEIFTRQNCLYETKVKSKISNSDINRIKEILESEEDVNNYDEGIVDEKMDIDDTSISIPTRTIINIPKLSDLCRDALNSSSQLNDSFSNNNFIITTPKSSFNKLNLKPNVVTPMETNLNTRRPINTIAITTTTITTTTVTEGNISTTTTTAAITTVSTSNLIIERELSVEEALAEMYRQAGVIMSDSDDNLTEQMNITNDDNDDDSDNVNMNRTNRINNDDQHDVVLINLQEILNSDNDVFIVQCDINENILNVTSNDSNSDDNNDSNNSTTINNQENYINNNNNNNTNNNNNNNKNKNNNNEILVEAKANNILQWIKLTNTNENDKQHNDNYETNRNDNDNNNDNDNDNSFSNNNIKAEITTTVTTTTTTTTNLLTYLNEPDHVSLIHHEEIVPDNYKQFIREEFFKYLHEKYIQKNISRYYHANRILKKYKKRVYFMATNAIINKTD